MSAVVVANIKKQNNFNKKRHEKILPITIHGQRLRMEKENIVFRFPFCPIANYRFFGVFFPHKEVK